MASSAGPQSTYAEQIHTYQSTLTLSDFRMPSLPDPKIGVFAFEVVIQCQLASASHSGPCRQGRVAIPVALLTYILPEATTSDTWY